MDAENHWEHSQPKWLETLMRMQKMYTKSCLSKVKSLTCNDSHQDYCHCQFHHCEDWRQFNWLKEDWWNYEGSQRIFIWKTVKQRCFFKKALSHLHKSVMCWVRLEVLIFSGVVEFSSFSVCLSQYPDPRGLLQPLTLHRSPYSIRCIVNNSNEIQVSNCTACL